MIILLVLLAIFLNGLLAGASLDQSIKQLPARHKMGVLLFTKYAQAADLKNGIFWYGILGIGAALVTIITGIMVYLSNNNQVDSFWILIAVLCSLLHSFTTSQAAPTYFSQKKVHDNEKALVRLFDKFEKWQTVRSIFVVAAFISCLLAVRFV